MHPSHLPCSRSFHTYTSEKPPTPSEEHCQMHSEQGAKQYGSHSLDNISVIFFLGGKNTEQKNIDLFSRPSSKQACWRFRRYRTVKRSLRTLALQQSCWCTLQKACSSWKRNNSHDFHCEKGQNGKVISSHFNNWKEIFLNRIFRWNHQYVRIFTPPENMQTWS